MLYCRLRWFFLQHAETDGAHEASSQTQHFLPVSWPVFSGCADVLSVSCRHVYNRLASLSAGVKAVALSCAHTVACWLTCTPVLKSHGVKRSLLNRHPLSLLLLPTQNPQSSTSHGWSRCLHPSNCRLKSQTQMEPSALLILRHTPQPHLCSVPLSCVSKKPPLIKTLMKLVLCLRKKPLTCPHV